MTKLTRDSRTREKNETGACRYICIYKVSETGGSNFREQTCSQNDFKLNVSDNHQDEAKVG